MKVIVLGAAVLDITAAPIESSDKWAEKQRIDSINYTLGGDAANQCVRLADIGVDVGIVSAIGADRNGELIQDELNKRGVDTRYLIKKKEMPTGTSLILLTSKGERTIFSVKGGAYAAVERDEIENILEPDTKALSVASFFIEQKLESDGGMLELLKKAKERGIITFADLSHDKNNLGFNGIQKFLPYIDYFLPSLPDAEKMNDASGAEENAKIYKNTGCRKVIIKCGAEGCYILSDDYSGWCRAESVKTVDTTGAGDCMAALFISRIIAGDMIDDACRFACAGATYSTLFHGACTKVISYDDIVSRL